MLRTTFLSTVATLALASAAQADAPRVATDIAPVHGLVARVMQGVGSPDLVVQPGASPHGYSMRPSEARALDQADLVVWMGEALTPWLEGSIDTLAGDARVVELLGVEGTKVMEFREGARFAHHDEDHEGERRDDHGHDDHGEEHHDEHEEEAHDDHDDHDGHDHDGVDPHAWLSPENGKLWLGLIATELAQLDPENADLYRANAVAGQEEIEAAMARIGNMLKSFRTANFMVFHDAYQYFEASFDLSAAGAISLSDASAPSPARIAEVQDTVAELNVSCVFSEPQFNPGLVATVLGGNAKTAVIDPMGTSLPLGPQFYPALLEDLARQMASCQ